VDDEEPLLRLQRTFLEKSGIDAALVSTGEEAVRYLQRARVDLVISDVRMPGAVDGLQLFEWVQANQPGLADHFIFVSGDVVGLDIAEIVPRPTARIAKPFRYRDYDRVVREVLGAEEERK
jgi:CheY-like chemotaxis protein